MTKKPGQSPLDDLGGRLRQARETQEEKKPKDGTSGSAVGVAMRISTELVLGVFIGAGIGWYLDKWLGTIPLFLIIFFILGFAAGLRNVFRAAAALGTTAGEGNTAPEETDEETDEAETSETEARETEEGDRDRKG